MHQGAKSYTWVLHLHDEAKNLDTGFAFARWCKKLDTGFAFARGYNKLHMGMRCKILDMGFAFTHDGTK